MTEHYIFGHMSEHYNFLLIVFLFDMWNIDEQAVMNKINVQ